MSSLLQKLQSATEGSRELDIAIAAEFSAESESIVEFGTRAWECPNYTTNLQDAVSLVPEGWRYLMDKRPYAESRQDGYRAEVYRQGSPETPETHWGPTMALALCIAIIKAHESKAEAA